MSCDLFHRHTRRCQVPTELLLKFFVILSECYSYLFTSSTLSAVQNWFQYFYHFPSPPPFYLLLHLPLAENPNMCGHGFLCYLQTGPHTTMPYQDHLGHRHQGAALCVAITDPQFTELRSRESCSTLQRATCYSSCRTASAFRRYISAE